MKVKPCCRETVRSPSQCRGRCYHIAISGPRKKSRISVVSVKNPRLGKRDQERQKVGTVT